MAFNNILELQITLWVDTRIHECSQTKVYGDKCCKHSLINGYPNAVFCHHVWAPATVEQHMLTVRDSITVNFEFYTWNWVQQFSILFATDKSTGNETENINASRWTALRAVFMKIYHLLFLITFGFYVATSIQCSVTQSIQTCIICSIYMQHAAVVKIWQSAAWHKNHPSAI
jgi:hypothetical protein